MTGRRTTLLLLVALLAGAAAPVEAKLNVVATTETHAAIARVVGGDRVSVTYLIKGSQDPHGILPKRSFSVLLNRADLLIVNGQGLETAWLPTALAESTNSKIREGKSGYLDASTGATLIANDAADVKASVLLRVLFAVQSAVVSRDTQIPLGNNHHYALDPSNGLTTAQAILDKLVLLDRTNAVVFQENYDRFASKLTAKLAEWDSQLKPYAGMEIVSVHRSWTYLARRHGLQILAYVEPPEPLVLAVDNVDNPPDRDEKAELVARMARRGVKLIVTESYQNQAMLREIARKANASVLVLPSSVCQAEGIDDYFALFDRIYESLTRALRTARTPT
jgi:zinc/manganese transport system substrate-binding protein